MIVENFRTCLQRSFQWKGRANRREFWYFIGTAMAITTMVAVVAEATQSTVIALAEMVLALALMPASLAVTVRRLHDRGHSALWAVATITIWLLGMGFLIAMLGMYAVSAAQGNPPVMQPASLVAYAMMAAVTAGLWITVLVMVLRKSDGLDNAYGPGP